MNAHSILDRLPPVVTPTLVGRILEDYRIDPWGIHGVGHWLRVMVNGLLLAESTGADREIVALFALFHDARRHNDALDPQHGPRGGQLAQDFCGEHYPLDDARLALLVAACNGHTCDADHDDVSVLTCYDADRLDLARVWKQPDPRLLRTDAARGPTVIAQAVGRTHHFHARSKAKQLWQLG